MKKCLKNVNKEKLFKILKWIFISIVMLIVINEFKKIFFDFDKSVFIKYSSLLSFDKLMIIAVLGIVSYIPLSFYDFILKKRVGINLDNKRLYRYSWIASSLSSLIGMGGTSAIGLKSYFYADYVEDKSLMVKEISRIVALNFSGFSVVCLVYSIMNISSIFALKPINILILCASLYVPAAICLMKRRYDKDKDLSKFTDSLKIMFISVLEWLTTVNLIFSLGIILGCNITLGELFKVFVISVSVAIISMTPSGVGSFDLSLVLGLSAFGVKKELVLLMVFLYRASYYILPVIIAGFLFGYDYYERKDFPFKKSIEKVSSKISQIILFILMFASALSLVFSFVAAKYIDKIIIIKNIMPYNLMFVSNSVSLAIGFALIGLLPMMMSKYFGAYKATLYLSIIGLIVSIFKFVCVKQILFLILFIISLILSSKQFYRKNLILTKVHIAAIITAMLSLYMVHVGVLLKEAGFVFSLSTLRYTVVLKSVYTSIIALIAGCFVFAVPKLFYTLDNFPLMSLDMCIDKVNDILNKYGGNNLSQYVFLEDKYVYINEKNDVFFQYGINENFVIILGEPSGNKQSFKEAMEEFYCICDLFGYTPIFIGIRENFIPSLHDRGYHFMKLGEEATVSLDEFTLQGRKMKSIRNALCRVEKNGCSFEILYPPFDEDVMKSLKDISDKWLKERKEKSFFMGFFNEEYLNLNPVAVVKGKSGEIIGFASLMNMYDNNKSISIDLMRFENEDINGVMDYLFVNLFMWAKETGYKKFNMGMAPLANVGDYKSSFLKERFARLIFTYGNKYYSFNGLKHFKDKYASNWSGQYIAYQKSRILFLSLISILKLTLKEPQKIKETDINSNSIKKYLFFLKPIIWLLKI